MSIVDDAFVGNLGALTRDLDDIEKLAEAALSGEPIDHAVRQRLADTPDGLTYAELTDRSGEQGTCELADLLDPAALAQLDEWRATQRLPWERADLVVVGISGLLGALASLYDAQVDTAVLAGLSQLKESALLRRWERETARLPIDYTGPKFGGPAHRVKSAGHDIGRFCTALNQIRTGVFEGTYWEDGRRMTGLATTTRSGLPFARQSEPHLAVALLLKHWAADFVTSMSLPLPGWTLLCEMPDPALRKFAHDAYANAGLNLRSGLLTPGLGVLATEVTIRTHTHLAAYRCTGTARLSPGAATKRTEMLLAAHAAAGAISLSKTAAAAIAGETAVAARHLDIPVLARIGMLALQVRSAARAKAGAPTWNALLAEEASTWALPEALTIADLLTEQAHTAERTPAISRSPAATG